MMHKKSDIVIGLTTFDNTMLRISVPAIGQIRQKFHLIIFNDNPTTTITRRQIRKLGYCGDLQVINSDENIGEFRARMEIVNAARNLQPNWFIFCDDDDILIDADIPNVSDDNFAVIQNAIVLRHRVSDLLRAMENPTDVCPDDENVILLRPHLGLAGTPVRASILFELLKIQEPATNAVLRIVSGLNFVPPIDAIMWNMVNMLAREKNPNAVPIYMNKVNYIKCDLDTPHMKYNRVRKPARNQDKYMRDIIDKCNQAFHDILAAAPSGQDD